MEQVYLVGSEDVSRAGSSMASAASEMRQAANNFDGSVQDMKRFMDDWLNRFQSILEEDRKKAEVTVVAIEPVKKLDEYVYLDGARTTDGRGLPNEGTTEVRNYGIQKEPK